MPRINVTINLSIDGANRPLRRAYVEHVTGSGITGVRVPGSQLYLTDNSGQVRDRQGDIGIDAIPNLFTGKIDIRVICHNSVVRVPNLLNIDHFADFNVRDGDTVTITQRRPNINSFLVMERCLAVYDRTLRPFEVFSRDFPLDLHRGRYDNTRNSRKRIEVFFPTNLPQPLSFVEPKSMHTGYPIIHLKGDVPGFPARYHHVVPAELSHALHFSRLSEAQRHDITVRYGNWLVSDFVMGGSAIHRMAADTDPLVAFVEAFDHFVVRLDAFAKANPNLARVNLWNKFIKAELESTSRFHDQQGTVRATGFGTLSGDLHRGVFTPAQGFLTAGARSATSIEGAIYAAIFLDFARRPGVGLNRAVKAYIRSRALSFGEFRRYIHSTLPNLRQQIDAVKTAWTL